MAPATPSNFAVCRACQRPILDGEPRWAGKEPDEHWHYACAEAAGLAHAPNVFIRDDSATPTVREGEK